MDPEDLEARRARRMQRQASRDADLGKNSNWQPTLGRRKSSQELFDPGEKPISIYIFKNADKFDEGTKVVVHRGKLGDLKKVIEMAAGKVTCKTGTLRKLYHPHGRQVKGIKELEHEGRYVGCGGEEFNEALPQALTKWLETQGEQGDTFDERRNKRAEHQATRDEELGKNHGYSGPQKRTPSKQDLFSSGEKPLVLYVYRNGDRIHEGERVLIFKSRTETVKKACETITGKCPAKTGPVMQIFTPDGKKIKSVDELEDEAFYVVAGAEDFDVLHISEKLHNIMMSDDHEMSRAEKRALKEATRDAELGKVDSAPRPPRQPSNRALFESGEKALVLKVFRNSDKYHKGERIVVQRAKIPNMEKLYELLQQKLPAKTGKTRQLFFKDGRLVKKPDDLEDGAVYVSAGAEELDTSLPYNWGKAAVEI
eukprot:GFYU01001338.1.p1 GENE.GFYU01001338.1~~GFYU01001338.1.p1  ORF type:complete len:425 (+),score=173.50 GFYU01001338.1:77-1351(+)